jgi:murein DD-endopeptidase MepM/ murein hydrolase activator NlpD
MLFPRFVGREPHQRPKPMTTILNRPVRSDQGPADELLPFDRTQAVIHSPSRNPYPYEDAIAHTVARLAIPIWQITTAGVIPRYAAHLTILIVVIAALILGRPAPASRSSAIVNQPAAATRNDADPPALETFFERGFYVDSNVVSRLADAHTAVPLRTRREIEIYVVQPGDTVQGIALMFGLQPETIMWSNPAIEDTPDLLKIGQEVVILPIDGVYHEVKDGDTLDGIARTYKVDISAITDVPWNNLKPPDYTITPGMKLIVAGGTKPIVAKVVTSYTGPIPSGATGTGQFLWPVLGRITQDYWSGHRALDIAVPPGTPVLAADSGYVSFVGWTDVGYGYLVRIDHGNGFETWYAHNTSFAVTLGERVDRGQIIAYSGSTGHSTGPHVHFEIRYLGVPQNPRIYLP